MICLLRRSHGALIKVTTTDSTHETCNIIAWLLQKRAVCSSEVCDINMNFHRNVYLIFRYYVTQHELSQKCVFNVSFIWSLFWPGNVLKNFLKIAQQGKWHGLTNVVQRKNGKLHTWWLYSGLSRARLGSFFENNGGAERTPGHRAKTCSWGWTRVPNTKFTTKDQLNKLSSSKVLINKL